MIKKIQYEEETGTSTAGKDGNGGGLREVTYRPPVHSKSTTCLGGCSERKGSVVSITNKFKKKIQFERKRKREICWERNIIRKIV